MFFNPVRLLIVDDAPADVEFFIHLFQTQNLYAYETWTAATGSDGLAVFRTMHPDCVLLDYNLPDMNGLDFIESALSMDTKHPVALVMVTGQGNEEIAVESLKRGALDYVVKDQMTAKQLCQVVDNAIGKASVQKMLSEGESRFEIVRKHVDQKLAVHAHNISELAQLLQRSPVLQNSPQELDYLNSLLSSVSSVQQSVESIRNAVGVASTPAPLDEVNMQVLWENLVELLEVELRKAKLGIVAEGVLPKVYGNAVALRQLLRQLVLYIIHNAHAQTERLCIQSDTRNLMWKVRLWTENADGEALEQPCFTMEASELASCQEIVQQHQGRMWTETTAEHSTSICFCIEPIQDSTA